MTQSKHTPGPWEVNADFDEFGTSTHVYVLHTARDAPLAEVLTNERLIAAAPEMYTELVESLRDLEQWDGTADMLEIVKENMRKTVAKVHNDNSQ